MTAIKVIRIITAAGLFVLAAKDLLSEEPEEKKKKKKNMKSLRLMHKH